MANLRYLGSVELPYPTANAPWHAGYTENPLGIKPTGEILPPRTKQMGYRA